jgi:DNA processing protein
LPFPDELPDDARGGAWTGVRLRGLDPEAERPYWIALALLPGVGQVGFARLLSRYGSAAAAWRAGQVVLQHLPRVPQEAALALHRLQRQSAEAVADEVIQAATRHGLRIVTALDERYPAAGELDAVEGSCAAVVGTRRPSGYGRAVATEIGDELARAGVTVVSGLALGIDGHAHQAAVAAGGRSVAVLPSALDRVYPPGHRTLARRLVDGGGALLSELPPGRPAARPDFARRNRVIAGISEAVIVVEAPDRSGALLTAQAAIDYGKELYAVPGPIDSRTSRGCNRLIADQTACIVTSAVSLLNRIGLARGSIGPVSVRNLSDAEGLILARLLNRSASIEELLAATRLSPGTLASGLTLLEARGLVTSFGGATFHATLAARRIGQPRTD